MKNDKGSMSISNQKAEAWSFLRRVGHYITLAGDQASGSIVNVFNGLFFDQHFSWACFRRSCLASLMSVAVCFLIMLSVVGMESLDHIYQNSLASFGKRVQKVGYGFSPTEYLFWVLAIPFVMNLLADYLALYKTRRLIGWVQRRKTACGAFSALILDQAGTYLCFFLGLAVATIAVMVGMLGLGVVWEPIQGTEGLFQSMGGHLLHLLAAMNQPIVMIPCVVSTFFSSFWLWLFGLSIVVPKISEVGIWIGNRVRISTAP